MSATPASPLPAPRELRTTPQLIQRFWHRIGCGLRDQSREDGFTLLEVVVSFTLFAIVAGAATTGIVNSTRAAHESQQRVDAANVAQHYIAQSRADTAQATKYPDLTTTAAVGNETFRVVRTIAFDGGATQCGDGVTFVVRVKVSQANTGRFLARSDARVLC